MINFAILKFYRRKGLKKPIEKNLNKISLRTEPNDTFSKFLREIKEYEHKKKRANVVIDSSNSKNVGLDWYLVNIFNSPYFFLNLKEALAQKLTPVERPIDKFLEEIRSHKIFLKMSSNIN